MKEQKKPRDAVIACGFILAFLVIDIVILFTGIHRGLHEWLMHIGVLLLLLRSAYPNLLLPRKIRNETEEKEKLTSLLEMGYLTIVSILITPAMIIICLTPEAPLLIKAPCALAAICAVWALASGWVKYIRKR